MADAIDVMNALAGVAALALYPSGSSGQSPVTGGNARIYPGWPDEKLDGDLANGVLTVTVFPGNAERNTDRYIDGWQQLSPISFAMSAAVTGNTITLSGTPGANINIGALVNGTPYSYQVQAGATLATAAAGLNALIPGATSSGAVITVPNASSLSARVGQLVTSMREVGRANKEFRITMWAPTQIVRDVATAAIDVALRSSRNLALADGSTGVLKYARTTMDDMPQKENLFRRDLIYSVEYGTFLTEQDQTVMFGSTTVTGGVDPAAPLVKTFNS